MNSVKPRAESTHYEELQVTPDASEEEIRRAHRRLARIHHPDLQQDPAARVAAEDKMRRLNEAVSVLLDFHARQAYDFSLVVPPAPLPMANTLRGVSRRELAFGGLLVFLVTGTLLWYFTSHNEPDEAWMRDRAYAPPLQSKAPAPPQVKPAARPVLPAATPAGTPAAPPPTAMKMEPGEGPAPADTGSVLRAEDIPAALPPLPDAPAATVEQRAAFAGAWLYGGENPGSKNLDMRYRTEYIELRITEKNGQLEGVYEGRYRVPDRVVSPRVRFRFRGQPGVQQAELPWTGEDGSEGKLELRMADRNTMEVNWYLTNYGNSVNVLSAGSATLVRSNRQ
jgi:hypothetical protein